MAELLRNETNFVQRRYDPLVGKYVRDIKPTDIFTLSADNATVAGSTIATAYNSSSYNIFITGVSAYSAGSATAIYLFTGTTPASSTFTLMRIASATFSNIVATREAPIFAVSGASTISIGANVSGGSVTAAIWGVREPIFMKVETSTAP